MKFSFFRNSAILGPAVLFASLVLLFGLVWLLVRVEGLHEILACGILLILLFLRCVRIAGTRVIFIFLASYLSLAYFVWRTTATLNWHGPVSFTFALILYAAELYGFVFLVLTNFVNIRPRERVSVELPENRAEWPSVDVFIPTYNEDLTIVETTALAAKMIDYPADKLKVFVLDDGGTDARVNHADKAIAEAARSRRKAFSELCVRHGLTYIAREKNIHAKAGNLNAGLVNSSGDLILILDADHVPTTDILRRTAGAFLQDSKLFLLQTPHFFGNPDPIEKNLRTFREMPGENEMFYSGIQKGLDHWNGAYFCGSAAIMRRRCLEEHGGFAGVSITEDAETAVMLHSAGYHSAYIDRPMVCGLACESIPAFMQQRSRWGVGMLQIFILKNPLFLRGLTVSQRLCYMSSCFFWFFPFTRIVFLVSPILFLLFGMSVYDTDARHMAIFAIPHLMGLFMLNHFMFGRLRWAFVGDIYEIIQSVPLLPAMIGTLIRPRAPVFKVTAKGEVLERDNLSPFARPYVVLFAINVGALFFGIYRAVLTDSLGAASITMVWSLLNCLFLLTCIGAMMERRQVRSAPRLPAKNEARLLHNDIVYPGRLFDLSNGGAGLKLVMPGAGRQVPRFDGECVIEVRDISDRWLRLHGRVTNGRLANGELTIGFAFQPVDDAEKKAKIRLVFGDSQRWVDFLETRRRNAPGVIASLIYVLRVGGASALEYFGHWLLGYLRRGHTPRGVDLRSAAEAGVQEERVPKQRVFRAESGSANSI